MYVCMHVCMYVYVYMCICVSVYRCGIAGQVRLPPHRVDGHRGAPPRGPGEHCPARSPVRAIAHPRERTRAHAHDMHTTRTRAHDTHTRTRKHTRTRTRTRKVRANGGPSYGAWSSDRRLPNLLDSANHWTADHFLTTGQMTTGQAFDLWSTIRPPASQPMPVDRDVGGRNRWSKSFERLQINRPLVDHLTTGQSFDHQSII